MTTCEKCGGRTDRPGLYGCKKTIHPKPDLAQKISAAIEADICDRRGLRQEFESTDEETQYEIRDEWARLIRKILSNI